MYKTDIVDRISRATGLSKRKTEQVVDCFLSQITESLSNGEPVKIIGFGTFDIVKRNSRTGRNISSGERVEIPSRLVPVFRPGRFLKSAIQSER